MTTAAVIGILSLVITFAIFVLNVTFKLGHHAARLEALEKWRDGIRDDMHEISDKMEAMLINFQTLTTLIEERTERRTSARMAQ